MAQLAYEKPFLNFFWLSQTSSKESWIRAPKFSSEVEYATFSVKPVQQHLKRMQIMHLEE